MHRYPFVNLAEAPMLAAESALRTRETFACVGRRAICAMTATMGLVKTCGMSYSNAQQPLPTPTLLRSASLASPSCRDCVMRLRRRSASMAPA
jgi:hypothetical protein